MAPQNPSAFPEIETDRDYDADRQEHWSHTYSYGGMTLRDWFAGQALTGVIAYQDRGLDVHDPLPSQVIARIAYELADAMLLEREKGTT